MRRLFWGILAAAALAGCATTETKTVAKKDAYDIRPDAGKDAAPTLVAWQDANRATLEAATTPATLRKFVESAAAADALLAKLKGAYETDPLTMTQVAAVTQLVMCPTCPKAPARRKLWVAALERAQSATCDGYLKTFLGQQLDLCR